jgi:hypothetical protein
LVALKSTHAKELDEADKKAATASNAAHTAELEKLKASHAKEISSLKKEHEAAQASLTSVSEKRKVRDM